MKKYIFIIIILILLGLGTGIYFYQKNHSKSDGSDSSNLNNFPYNSTRVSTLQNETNTNSSENTATENVTQENTSNDTNTENNNASAYNGTQNTSSSNSNKTQTQAETEISSFRTKIYTKDSDRQNNVSITCSHLNNTIVENGKTFSFCNTVGKATSSKGYKKADVYQNGEKIEALGRTEIARLVLLFIMLFLKLKI